MEEARDKTGSPGGSSVPASLGPSRVGAGAQISKEEPSSGVAPTYNGAVYPPPIPLPDSTFKGLQHKERKEPLHPALANIPPGQTASRDGDALNSTVNSDLATSAPTPVGNPGAGEAARAPHEPRPPLSSGPTPHTSETLLQMSGIRSPRLQADTAALTAEEQGASSSYHNPFAQHLTQPSGTLDFNNGSTTLSQESPPTPNFPRSKELPLTAAEGPTSNPNDAFTTPRAETPTEYTLASPEMLSHPLQSVFNAMDDLTFIMRSPAAVDTPGGSGADAQAAPAQVEVLQPTGTSTFQEFHCRSCGVLNLLQPGYSMAKCGQCAQLLILTPNRAVVAAAAAPPPVSSSPLSQSSPFNHLYPQMDREPFANQHHMELTPSECSDGTLESAGLLFNMHQGLPSMQGWLAKKGGSRGVVQGIDSTMSKVMTGSGRRNWRKRFFVAQWVNRTLYYYKDEGDIQALGSVDLLFCSVRLEQHCRKTHTFVVDSRGRGSMMLSAPSREEMERWVEFLMRASVPDEADKAALLEEDGLLK